MIGEAHSYYATAPDYSHFLVLTQSCDLVRRKGSCKSRYITLCAVRPLALAVAREFKKYLESIPGFPVLVGKSQDMVLARQFLERVINNTVDGIFFIPRGATDSVDTHLCAFLTLSIALRTDHFDACLRAKVGQATGIFAAKIGSLTSGLYARIATPDLAEIHGSKAADQFRNQFFDELGLTSVAWLSEFQLRELRQALQADTGQAPAAPLTETEAEGILSGLPSLPDALATRAAEVLIARKLLPDDENVKRKAKNFLLNDSRFSRLARSTESG